MGMRYVAQYKDLVALVFQISAIGYGLCTFWKSIFGG